jgi:hypothetical protein
MAAALGVINVRDVATAVLSTLVSRRIPSLAIAATTLAI